MPNFVSELTVQEYDAAFGDAEGLVLCTLDGLTVEESDALRGKLEEQGAGLRLVRNKLARKVLSDRGHEFPADVTTGSTAIAWGTAEATVMAAKVLTEPELKKTGKVKLKAGMLEGNVLDASEAVMLADVPDRDTLNAQLLGVLQGPARGIVSVVQGPLGGLARVLQAKIDAGGGAEEA